jgi:acetate kinase
MDRAANDAGADVISASNSQIDVRIIPTSEETTIARDCVALLAGRKQAL